jgi:hypothetical protein
MTVTNPVTNFDFAKRVGIHYTMASRLRNGERRPGLATVIGTMRAFSLTSDEVTEWLEAISESPAASGLWLRGHIFGYSDADLEANAAALPAAG